MLFRKKSSERNPLGRNRDRRPMPEQQSPAIFSYYARRDQQSELTVRDVDRPRDDGGNLERSIVQPQLSAKTLLALGVILLVIIWQLLLFATPKVVITGSSTNAAQYTHQAQQLATDSLLSRTKFTVNTTAIDKNIQASYPELEAVKTSIPMVGNALRITIVPPTPVLVYTAADGRMLALDKGGRDISLVIGNMQHLTLPHVIDQNSSAIKDGAAILPASTVSFIESIVYQLNAANLKPSTLTLVSGGGELDSILPGRAYMAKFNLQGDARLQAGTLIAAVSNLQSKHTPPSKYIDVRVPGRAYYQ